MKFSVGLLLVLFHEVACKLQTPILSRISSLWVGGGVGEDMNSNKNVKLTRLNSKFQNEQEDTLFPAKQKNLH